MKFNPQFTVTMEIARYLVDIEKHREAFNTKPLTAQLLHSLRVSSRLRSTHFSTQIEGNRLTMEEVEKVVLQQGGFAGRERDEAEVTNYYKALEWLEQRDNSILTEDDIRTIHSLVMTGKPTKTAYRDGQNVIRDGATGTIVYMPPEAKDVPPLMQSLIAWTHSEIEKSKLPIPIIAAILHYQIATIHPYFDGNGRTARLATTMLLRLCGYGLKGIYSLEEYYAKNILGYYTALAVDNIPNYYMGRAEADISGFISYFLEAMAASFSAISTNTLGAETPQKLYNSAALRELTAQQKAILSLFLEQKEVSSKDVATYLGISLRATRTMISKWTESHFIEVANPSNRARTYQLCPSWEAHITA